MTEKRYNKIMNHYGTSRTYCIGIYDNQNNRELQNSNQVITELNALHEEKQELQHQINYLEDRLDDCICIKKENKKLKKKLEWCRITVDGLKGDVE